MSYLACDPSKLVRARKTAMLEAQEKEQAENVTDKIVGMDYDGRKDPQTRAMVADSSGKLKMRKIKEEHVSVTEEPSER